MIKEFILLYITIILTSVLSSARRNQNNVIHHNGYSRYEDNLGNNLCNPCEEDIFNIDYEKILKFSKTSKSSNLREFMRKEISHPVLSTDINVINDNDSNFSVNNSLLYIRDQSPTSNVITQTVPKPTRRMYRCSKKHTCSKSKRSQCLCHDDCLMYGNCCIDYLQVAIERNNTERMWTCMMTGNNFGSYAISFCPKNWDNAYVKHNCEANNHEGSYGLHATPVTSRSTFLIYRNVYCAICNKDSNATFWVAQFQCRNNISEKDLSTLDVSRCKISFSKPNIANKSIDRDGFLRKQCIPDLIGKCLPEWQNEKNESTRDIVNKCALVYAPVNGATNGTIKKYKNEFCAKCNDVEDITCLQRIYSAPPKTTFTALPILFDMDFTRGGVIVGMKRRCPKLHLYDVWLKECRSVFCAKHYVFVDNKCVPMSEENGREQVRPSVVSKLAANCTRTKIDRDDVQFLGNGTVKVLSSNVYKYEDYEIENNDSVIMCITEPESKLEPTTTELERTLTVIFTCVSVVSLFLKICFDLFSKKRHKLPTKIVLSLSATLFTAQLLFLFGPYFPASCTLIAILTHFSFLSSFFWMNILAYDIWKTFASSDSVTVSRQISRQFIRYCIYGWGTPLTIVIISILAYFDIGYSSLDPKYGESSCWISNKKALAAFFALPVFVLIFSNVVFFVITASNIRKTTKATKAIRNNNRTKDRVRFVLYSKLAFIMGLTWSLGIATAFSDYSVIRCIFIILNSLQGVYVLIAFTHFDMKKFLRQNEWALLTSRRSKITSVTMTTSLSRT